jgi:hypothetical protein
MSTACKGAAAPILGALLVLVSGLLVPSRAADPEPLAGTVRDTLGNVLAGVEILFVRLPSETFLPTAVARSDGAGRFEVSTLVPGHYRVAAVKMGYRTTVGQIDTLARDTVELVLRPAVKLDAESMPRDASWALRLPSRGMLYETGPGPSEADLPASSPSLDDAMRMEIEQLFSLSAGVAERRPDDTEIRPSATRAMLASAIGERGNIVVEGRRERLGSSIAGEFAETTASRSADSVNLDLAYDTSLDTRLVVNAFFNQNDYELSAASPEAPAALEQQHQTWGYDASWSKQLGATRRFAVALAYQDTSLVDPGHEAGPASLAPADSRDALSNRAVGARGSFESVMSDRHNVHVALRTQLLSRPPSTWTSLPFGPGDDAQSSWTVQGDAQDTWSVSAPFSLIYGLGYKQALTTSDAALIVPRIGGSLTAAGWHLRALVSYHTVTGSDAPPGASQIAPFRPERPLGYEAEVELPVAGGVRLRGGSSYTPIQLDYFGYLRGVDGGPGPPLYLTDGNSAVHEHHLALIEERGGTRTYIELADGRAEGSMAPLLPFEGPVPIMYGGQLSYRNGRVGVRVPAWGTDLRLEYRRVEAESSEHERDLVDSVEESVEVRVRQDVSEGQVPGDWRLLLALRLGTVRSNDLDGWSSHEGTESVNALNRRISAGVSVLF